MNKSFHLVSLVCMYTMKTPKINESGIISVLCVHECLCFMYVCVYVFYYFVFFDYFTTMFCGSVPTDNVAGISSSATVLEGVSRSRNALLNGNTRDYDWDSGYTCHQLGSGSIIVQMAQPYIIGSMRYVHT